MLIDEAVNDVIPIKKVKNAKIYTPFVFEWPDKKERTMLNETEQKKLNELNAKKSTNDKKFHSIPDGLERFGDNGICGTKLVSAVLKGIFT